jgi:pimeloyl-ACP methyl ester carboxylesterase
MTTGTIDPTITDHEAAQIARANATTATPVVFVHGLWLLPSSWDRWVTLFEEAGYVSVTPGWPDDPETVAEAREHPQVLAGKGISEIADYEEAIIGRLERKPVIIGHSFGGLLTMILAGRGLAAASVAISPAPFRGVLPLPFSALRTASVALRNPATGTARSRSATTSSVTASQTRSARTRPRSCTSATLFPAPANRSSRRHPRT